MIAIEHTLKIELEDGSPYIYKLELNGEDKKRSISQKWFNNEICKFASVVTLDRKPKLYIVRKTKTPKDILYVGYCDRGIDKRLRDGLKPYRVNGYHGYGWMNEEDVELLVWVFQSFKPDIPENKGFNKLLKRTVECVEAEIVYAVRNDTGSWPQFQTEIHFGNVNREEVMRTVTVILKRNELI